MQQILADITNVYIGYKRWFRNLKARDLNVKGTVKLPLCLTKHHIMKI